MRYRGGCCCGQPCCSGVTWDDTLEFETQPVDSLHCMLGYRVDLTRQAAPDDDTWYSGVVVSPCDKQGGAVGDKANLEVRLIKGSDGPAPRTGCRVIIVWDEETIYDEYLASAPSGSAALVDCVPHIQGIVTVWPSPNTIGLTSQRVDFFIQPPP